MEKAIFDFNFPLSDLTRLLVENRLLDASGVVSEFSHPEKKAKFKGVYEYVQCTLAHLQPQAAM